MVSAPPQPAPKSGNKGLVIGVGGVAILAVIGFAIVNSTSSTTTKLPVTPIVLSSTPAEVPAGPDASITASPAAAPTLKPMDEEAGSAASADAAPLLAPGDDMLGTYSCTVLGKDPTTYPCLIKRDDKGKLVLYKTCCSWPWYLYLSNVSATGFNGAGTAQVDNWAGSQARGSFTRKGPDRITGRVHTVNGDHGKYGEWDDDVVMVRAK